ncbi:MAG TPA: SGNH/GDSL hydrolase family protein [Thermoanaerobaculia bacterium]|nr:SGNH/GDSL hydrolase family protein [Thermoanaerobaculia bacterium]
MAKKLALSLFTVLFSLLAAELLLRATGAAPKVYAIQKGRFQLSKNPKLGYEPAPLSYQGKDLSFYDYLGASNREGFRDVDHAVAKPPGVYRIVVLGDSIAAGLHVDRYEDIFPPTLERLLNARGLKAEVINLAVSGYNTQQEVEIFKEKGLRYQPDLVLLAYSLSSREHIDGDILKTLLEEERAKGGSSGVRIESNPILVHSALYRFFRFRIFHRRAQHVADIEGQEGQESEQKYLDLVSGDTVAEYFGVLRDLARENRFSVLVAVFPRFVKTFNYYRFAEQHKFARELAEKNGFAFVDLLEPFARCRAASSTPIELDNFHPSAYGHRCAAETLAGAILAQHPAAR